MSNQWKAYGRALFYCKSGRRKAGSYHYHNFTTVPFFKTFIAFDEVTSPILKLTSSWTGWHFVFWISLPTGFERTNVWAACPQLETSRSDNLFSIVNNSLERSILVSCTSAVRNIFHIYPKTFDETMHVNVVEPSDREIGKKEPETFVYLRRKRDGYTPSRGLLDAIFKFSSRTIALYVKEAWAIW